MKNILLKILFLLTCSVVNAQEKILDEALISISYRYEYVSNLLSPQPKQAVMTLLIGKQWSLFYNKHNDDFYFNRTDTDSRKYSVLTIDENGNMKRTHPADYSGTIGPTEYTYLDRFKMEEIFVGRVLFRGFYTYSEKYSFPKWSVNQEEKTIMGYHCQKATTNYLGRKWIAWFTQDIPVMDGPYKFSGLPGLIVKIEDSKGDYIFDLKETKKIAELPDFQLRFGNTVVLKRKDYEKQMEKFRKDPSSFMNQGNMGGDRFEGRAGEMNMRVQPDPKTMKDRENRMKEQQKKLNNPIEK